MIRGQFNLPIILVEDILEWNGFENLRLASGLIADSAADAKNLEEPERVINKAANRAVQSAFFVP